MDESSHLFGFESAFVDKLRCIPMAVRLKLDLAGIKLKLAEWAKLPAEDRRECLVMPCGDPGQISAFSRAVEEKVVARAGQTPQRFELPARPAWDEPTVPTEVLARAREVNITISESRWRELTRIERFALVKLSRPGHENANFLPAARELGLGG